ncbi:hypothetical protein GCM10028787_31050 [Brachybacterium horti]
MQSSVLGGPRVTPRLIHPVLAWSLVIVVYLAGYGLAVWSAVWGLMGWGVSTGQPPRSDDDRLTWLLLHLWVQLLLAFLCVAALWIVRSAHRRTHGNLLPLGVILACPGRSTWILVPAVMAVITGSFAVGSYAAAAGVIGPALSRDTTTGGPLVVAVLAVVHSVVAGPMEEVAVLLVPVVLLRAGGYGWATVYATCISLRLAFHLDYGIPIVAGLTIWAALMVAIYRTTGQLFALVLAHGLYNGLGGLEEVLRAYAGVGLGEHLALGVAALRWTLVAVGFTLGVIFIGRKLTSDSQQESHEGRRCRPQAQR